MSFGILSAIGVLMSFVQSLVKEVHRLGENPDEIIRHLVTPKGEVLMPGIAGFIVEQIKGKRPGKTVAQQLAEWKLFYKKFFRHSLDMDTVSILDRPEGFDRLVVVAKDFTLNQIYDVIARHFDCWRYVEDLDKAVTRNDRDANKTGTYAIWVRDRQEADEENQNISAREIWERKVLGITLAEQMLYELKFWDETGDHLDIDNLTICAGSRASGVCAVCMSFSQGDQSVYVSWIYPGSACPGWRTPSVGFSS